MNKIIGYNGISILTGINTHPGSGPIESHDEEIKIFENVLDDIENKKNPIMIEVGCFWAVWSLLFRKRFTGGKNILVELGKRQLDVGKFNFKLNNFDCSCYHGGFFIEKSSTFKNKKYDLEYDANENIFLSEFIPSITETEELTGPELDFMEIYKSENLDVIDLLHLDIQGSEYFLLEYLKDLLSRKKILNIVVATHSAIIHDSILDLIASYEIKINIPFGKMGGDGYIHSKILKENV